MGETILAAIFAALIAGAAGGAELAARYRDDPIRALFSFPAGLYLLLNAGAGYAAAFMLSRFAPETFLVGGKPDVLMLALAAGFGSLAALRVSIVKLKVGADELSVGPALVIDQVLKVVDRGVDRHLASHRATIAEELASSIDFEDHGMSLVATCIALLQNASADEQNRMIELARGLGGRDDIPPLTKTVNLILALLGLVGEHVLRAAIKVVQADPPPP